MKHTCLFLYFLLLFSCLKTPILASQPSQALQGLVENIVLQHFETDHQPHGMVIGILDEGYTYYYNYGTFSATDSAKIDSSTLFHIGSITKVFTTSLLMQMVADSLVQLRDPISQYLPDSVTVANPMLQYITLRQLATHTSGLPREPYNIPFTLVDKANPYANYTLKDAYQFLMTFKPLSPKKKRKKIKKKPKATFKYSHFGMGLLGHLLENAAGKRYKTLLNDYILQPLQMSATTMPPEKGLFERIAPGHYFNGKPAPPQYYASLQASEGLYSNLSELLRFVAANMDTTQTVLPNILQKTHDAQINTNMKYVKVAYGWYTIDQGKKMPRMLTHSGRTDGYSNFVGFVKETQTAVVILSNSSNRIDRIGFNILELLNR